MRHTCLIKLVSQINSGKMTLKLPKSPKAGYEYRAFDLSHRTIRRPKLLNSQANSGYIQSKTEQISYGNNSDLFSQRFALKSRWIVWSSKCDWFERYADIICPTLVVLSGNRHNSTEWPKPSKYESSRLHWEVFPHRSKPSRTTNAPLESILPILRLLLLSIRNGVQEHFGRQFKWNFDRHTNKAPKFLEFNNYILENKTRVWHISTANNINLVPQLKLSQKTIKKYFWSILKESNYISSF